MTNPSKSAFLSAYRAILVRDYAWAAMDAARLSMFMASVEVTLNTDATTVNLRGAPAALEAFRAIGCKGTLSYKALRALPA